MSVNDKECSHHNNERRCRKFYRRLFSSILIISFIILLAVLLVYSIVQPHKPTFILKDATIFNFTVVSALNILSTNIQVTIYSQNPNDHIGIYYQNSNVYATYKNQQITYKTVIPAVYQGQNDENIWSPFIYGNNVPISPYNALSIANEINGVWLMIKMDGHVKWKVWSLITGVYRLHVMCPAYIPFGNENAGVVSGAEGVKYQISQDCSVTV